MYKGIQCELTKVNTTTKVTRKKAFASDKVLPMAKQHFFFPPTGRHLCPKPHPRPCMSPHRPQMSAFIHPAHAGCAPLVPECARKEKGARISQDKFPTHPPISRCTHRRCNGWGLPLGPTAAQATSPHAGCAPLVPECARNGMKIFCAIEAQKICFPRLGRTEYTLCVNSRTKSPHTPCYLT